MQPAESSHPAHSVWSHFTAEPRVARLLCVTNATISIATAA